MGLDNPVHLILLLMVLLLVFGAKRLPEMGRSLGDGLRGFKEAVHTEVSPAPQDSAVAAHIVAANAAPEVTGEPVSSPDLTTSA